ELGLQKQIHGDQVRQDASKLQHEIGKDDRAYGFYLSRLLVEKEADMSTTDVRKVLYLRNILIAALSPNQSLTIIKKMADMSADFVALAGYTEFVYGSQARPRTGNFNRTSIDRKNNLEVNGKIVELKAIKLRCS